MRAFPTTKGFGKQNRLHKSYLKELQEQTVFKDFSTLMVGIEMDTTSHQRVAESPPRDPAGPPLGNCWSTITAVVCYLKFGIN